MTADAESPLIRFEAVTKAYLAGDQVIHALDAVDLEIRAGEYVAVMGPSGSGKSTLMNVIGLLDHPTSGRYLLGGHDVTELDDDARARLRRSVFGFVFQSYNLIPRIPVVQQVELPLMYHGTPDRTQRALDMLALVGLLEKADRFPTQLSGGEQQRVAIARSLVVEPRIILADEPTGALDSRTSRDIMSIFTRLIEERGITVVLVTHETDVARYAHRLLRMRDGRIVEDLPTAEALGPVAAA